MRYGLIIGVGIYVVLVAAVLFRLWRSRRMERRLQWPSSTTQRQMEHYGTRYMTRLGWGITLTGSHGTRSLYGCIKHEEYLFILFLRENSYFSRLLDSLRRDNGYALTRTVIVLFEPATEMMTANAREVRVSLMHYTDLWQIEEKHRGLLPNVMAARAEERWIKQNGRKRAGEVESS
jgi:hypothetical protein